MAEPEVLVIGAGPAGVSAAVTLAEAGVSVRLCDQGPRPGGAIHRQPAPGAAGPVPVPAAQRRRWADLMRRLGDSTVVLSPGTVFSGLDATGAVLVEDRAAGRVKVLRPRAVILATGAVERIVPRPGWDLPGVVTAGALQVMMKESGTVPAGRTLLAGSGPLLIAVAAQMAHLGRPPVAVVEAGRPLAAAGRGLGLLATPALLREAAGYMATLLRRRVSWLQGARVVAIEPEGAALRVTVEQGRHRRTFLVDRVALHDGIRPNDTGLPPDTAPEGAGPHILRAGDCREALGGAAAVVDGERVARLLLARLGRPADAPSAALSAYRRAQAVLADVFRPVVPPFEGLPPETILCRCERRTLADLQRVVADGAHSAREVKLNGRFAMGACQGRFCADSTEHLLSGLLADAAAPGTVAGSPGRARWPVRPVSVAALIAPAASPSDPSLHED